MNRNLKRAIDWIAINDEGAEMDPATVSEAVTVLMAADLFDADPKHIAQAIVTKRAERNHKEALAAFTGKAGA